MHICGSHPTETLHERACKALLDPHLLRHSDTALAQRSNERICAYPLVVVFVVRHM
jgi:hypothetical protein